MWSPRNGSCSDSKDNFTRLGLLFHMQLHLGLQPVKNEVLNITRVKYA